MCNPYSWQLQSRRLQDCLLFENANTADTVLTCFLFSVNTKWKCKAVLWKAWNRHLLWVKIVSRAAARTVLAKQSQKVLPGLQKAKHGLYQHLHNNVFFYSGFLSPMTFCQSKNSFSSGGNWFKCIELNQGTSLWLQPKNTAWAVLLTVKAYKVLTVSAGSKLQPWAPTGCFWPVYSKTRWQYQPSCL